MKKILPLLIATLCIPSFSFAEISNIPLYASTANGSLAVGSTGAVAWMSASGTPWYATAIGVGALGTPPTTPLSAYGISPNNTAVGFDALAANRNGYWNVAIGKSALASNIDGGASVAIGNEALMNYNDIEGGIAIGNQALRAAVSSLANIAIGNTALYNLKSGGGLNIAIGHHVFFDSTTAGGNIGIGYVTGQDLKTGMFNTFVGHNTGRGITTGSYNTILGAQVIGLPPNLSNNIILADGTGKVRIQVSANGNVGIGTATPSHALTVIRPSAPQLALGDGSTTNALWTLRSAGGVFSIATSTHAGQSRGPAALTIDANGNLTTTGKTSAGKLCARRSNGVEVCLTGDQLAALIAALPLQ